MCKIMKTYIRHLCYFLNIATVNICVSMCLVSTSQSLLWFSEPWLSTSCQGAQGPIQASRPVWLPSAPTPAVLLHCGATKTPRQSGRVPLRQPVVGWRGFPIPTLSQCGPQLQPSVPNSGLAVCSCLSAAPCYKANVICSVKCRP